MTPLLLCFLGTLLGLGWLLLFTLVAKVAQPHGDPGPHWARMAWLAGGLAGVVLLSGAFETIWASFWLTGFHLQMDRALPPSLSVGLCLLAAFAIPLAVWMLAVPVSAIFMGKARAVGPGLAGSVGHLPLGQARPSRRWVLLCALPLALVLVGGYPELGTGLQAFPAAAWSTTLIAVLSLLGIAISSRGKSSEKARAEGEPASPAATRAPEPWPAAMRRLGVEVKPLYTWPVAASAGDASGYEAGRFPSGRDPRSEGIAPELVMVLGRLIGQGDRGLRGSQRLLVMAPDDCGQWEVVAEAAAHLADPIRLKTLIVAPGNASFVAARLGALLPLGVDLAVAEKDSPLPEHGDVWVVDAETLAGRMSALMKQADLLSRLGLLVWWDVHTYTGVLAANMWAVSRRLQRFVDRRGRADTRVLVLARSGLHAEDQHARFIRHLLPYHYDNGDIFPVALRFARDLTLHRIADVGGFLGTLRDQQIDNVLVHPTALSSLASVQAHWATHLAPMRDFTVEEFKKLSDLTPQGERASLGALLAPGAAGAGVQLLQLDNSNVLSVKELVASGGRTCPTAGPHHAAIPPGEPYANYLLGQLNVPGEDAGSLPTSRWLVGAEGHERILRLHLREALAELPDTRKGLQETFMLREEIIAATLDELARAGRLDQREVRYLDSEHRMLPDQHYTAHAGAAERWQPLTTVGSRLVQVVAPDEANVRGGIRMWVDYERLPIQAYPERVFMSHDGRRYRVQRWHSYEELEAQGGGVLSVSCTQEGRRNRTFRVRSTLVDELRLLGGAQKVLRMDKGQVVTGRVSLLYEETFRGIVEIDPRKPQPIQPQLDHISTSFETRGLLMQVSLDTTYRELCSLAEALRQVIPVHVGVEEDAVEVVVVEHVPMGHQDVFGLVVVDLFPGGIGLSETLDDSGLLLDILRACRDWLARCPCQSEKGCPACLHTIPSRATVPDGGHSRAAALAVLDRLMF
ncbi:MAG: Zn-binding domain-containing protein [Pseudomonadota bacterium]